MAALLLSANAVVPFERFVDVLWDSPPRSARQQIHNVIAALRRSLADLRPEVDIVTSDVGYRLQVPESWIDVHRFQSALREADQAEAAGRLPEAVRLLRWGLSQWRGPALTGLTSQHLANVAARLDEQRLASVEHLMHLRLRLGEAASLVGELIELVAESPLRESLRSTLMIALAQSGRQAEALAVFEDARNILAEELGLDPGPQLRLAYTQILNGTSDLEAPGQPMDKSGRHSNYLPHDLVDFTGRGPETTRLLSDIQRAAPTALVITALEGMGGIGKTTLAVRLGHQLSEEYPDGQYFIDLHGFSALADPLSPMRALELLLRDAGVTSELLPPDLEGRSSMWRSVLSGRRILLVLDNAVDVTQIRPLLPGTAGALVIITSRRRLAALEGTRVLQLDVLPHGDAVALFEHIVGKERVHGENAAVEQVVELCGRLPLAIRIAAARFRDRSSWTMDDLVQKLRDQKGRIRFLATGDRSVMRALALSHKYLGDTQRRAFALLSIHPGTDFDVYSAAAITRLTLDETEFMLETLFEDHLLQQAAPGRYFFHDLVRDCAQELLVESVDEESRERALDRLLDYFLAAADQWCRPLAKWAFSFDLDIREEPLHLNLVDREVDAIRLLDENYHNFIAAAAVANDMNRRTAEWQLVVSLLPYLSRRNYDGEVDQLVMRALDAADRAGDAYGRSACLTGLAAVHRSRGDNERARELIRQAIGISLELGDRGSATYQRINLGIMHANDNQFDEALAAFSAAADLAGLAGDVSAQADIANNRGVIYRIRGRFDEALDQFRWVLDLDGECRPPQARALTLNNLASVMYLQGNPHDAIKRYDEALELSRSIRSRIGEAFALIGLCNAHRSIGDPDTSLQHGRRALDISRELGLYDLECDAMNALGDSLVSRGELSAGESVFNQARQLAAQHSLTRFMARAQEGLAHVMAARGLVEEARELWSLALDTFPPGVFDAESSRIHLGAAGVDPVHCRRCRIHREASAPDCGGAGRGG
ncbi:AfsR/SARP family transcriptional regulator [Nonomuraea montanisoli]|nr:BTAD domain-containing putative transcriptional regulator [Nonomuraea montanisoli]